ncbi:MAG: SHOCT domain-containing protein [Leucobacter sp.]
MRRAGRPGLIGLAARTAVVTGTANAMQTRAMRKRQEAEAQLAPQAPSPVAAPQAVPQAAPPAPAAPHTAGDANLADELSKLGELHAAGLLTAEEFAAAKARLLS